MASTPTTRNSLNKQGTGDNTGTWGSTLNDQVFDLVDTALDGVAAITVNANVTLSSTNYVDNEARNRVLKLSGAGGFNVVIPGVEKWYLVDNGCSAAVTIKTSGGTGPSIAAGAVTAVYCDGTTTTATTSTGGPGFPSTIYPSVNDGAALGTTSLKWSDLYLASGSVINWNSGDITATHSADTLTFAGGSSYSFSGAVSGTSFSMAQGAMNTSGANGYTGFFDGSNSGALYLGGTSDPTNYYRNTTHSFQSRAAGATFATLNSGGLSVTGVGAFTGALSGTTGTFSSNITGVACTLSGDLTTYRAGAPTTGVIFLNQAQSKYLYNDGSQYVLPSQGLAVSGGVSATTGSFSGAISATSGSFSGAVSAAGFNSTGSIIQTIGVPYYFYFLSGSNAAYVYADGSGNLQWVGGTAGLGSRLHLNNTTGTLTVQVGGLDVAGNIGTGNTITGGAVNSTGNSTIAGTSSVGALSTATGTITNLNSTNIAASNNITTSSLTVNASATVAGSVTATSDVATSANLTALAGFSFAVLHVNTSDERLKDDLRPIADPGAIIDATEVHDFRWKKDGKRDYGVMAQHAVTVLPAAVAHHEEADMWGVDYSKYVPILLAEVKLLRSRLAALEAV